MTKIQLRRDTSTNWASVNPTLSQGEIGVETDASKAKLGDGATAYNALPYFIGDDKETIPFAASDETTPIVLNGGVSEVVAQFPMTLTGIRASLVTPQTSGALFTVDIFKNGVSILSTKLTFDNAEVDTKDAATPVVISDTAIADGDKISSKVTQVGDGTAAGLKIYPAGTRT